jgi:hypothetical protein
MSQVMKLPLWMTIEPGAAETRVMLHAGSGSALRARLPLFPAQPHALVTLLEAMAAWHGRSLCAVLDADAEDVRRHGERWAKLIGELDGERISVEWSCRRAGNRRDRFISALGDFRSALRLIQRATAGGAQ